MTVEKVTNPKAEKPKLRCIKCGNKMHFKANSKTKTIDCDVCGQAVIQAVEDLTTYKEMGGK